MSEVSVVDSLIEVALKKSDDFLKVKETLTRIGISGRADEEGGKRKLFQSCHILHKKGRYYIVHFKELFALDGRKAYMDEKDYARRNKIATLLQEWGMVTIVNPEVTKEPEGDGTLFRVVKFADKDHWDLVQKYSIGNDNKETV